MHGLASAACNFGAVNRRQTSPLRLRIEKDADAALLAVVGIGPTDLVGVAIVIAISGGGGHGRLGGLDLIELGRIRGSGNSADIHGSSGWMGDQGDWRG